MRLRRRALDLVRMKDIPEAARMNPDEGQEQRGNGELAIRIRKAFLLKSYRINVSFFSILWKSHFTIALNERDLIGIEKEKRRD